MQRDTNQPNSQFLPAGSSIRERILSLLSSHKTMSSTELISNFSGSSPQAVYKSLNQLAHDGIVSKNGSVYSFSPNWLSNINNFANQADGNSNQNFEQKVKNHSWNKPFTAHFTDWNECCVAIATILANRTLNAGKPETIYSMLDHAWFPLRFNFSDFDMLKKVLKFNPFSFATVASNTPYDKWIVNQYLFLTQLFDGRKSVKILPKREFLECDVIVQGDKIIQIYYSPETKTYFDKAYSEISGMVELFNYYLRNPHAGQNLDIKLVVQQNETLAATYKAKVIQLMESDQ